MITFSDLQNNQDLSNLPKIEESHFQLLWDCDYWDGPKSGILLYQKRKLWFQMFNENAETDDHRQFAIIELLESQLDEEEYWHELFKEKVGTHTDYDEYSKRPVGALKPREMWPEFYEIHKNRKPRDFSKNLVVGWFEL
jgi:hypothetical protein